MTKEKVLILHGWKDNSKKGFIPELVKTLEEKGYSPKAIDLPNTDAPKFEEWFDSAEKEIKEIGKDNLSIVGHSMGGLLALKLAEKHKLDKLVLVAPVGLKPSEEYFKKVSKDLSEEDLDVFKKYQDREIDADKIKENAREISFIFGGKDPWILDEIKNNYIEKFKDVANIQTYDNYTHMSESEGVKKLPELEKLFSKVKEKEEAKPEVKEGGKKTDSKKKDEKPKSKKDEAIAWGRNLHMSKKQGVYICSFIKNKKIDVAIRDLEQVKLKKKVVPFKGEIPHRKGKGMMSGRYPVKGAGLLINVLKSLKGNVIVNGLDLDNVGIYFASASWARRPARSDRREGKRTNLLLKAREVNK